MGRYDLVYAYHASDVGDPWKKYNVAAPPFLNDLPEMGPKLGVLDSGERGLCVAVVVALHEGPRDSEKPVGSGGSMETECRGWAHWVRASYGG